LYPEKVAVVDGPRRFTYRQLAARVNQLSHALLQLGVAPGDRVCILSPNSHFFLESFYATSQIGAILVPLNYRLTAADHEYILNHAGVTTVLVDHEYTKVVDEIRPNLKTVRNWIVAKDEGAPPRAGSTGTSSARESDAPPPVLRFENDVVSINYTSGTTARPKGVMLTHRNCYINAYSLIGHLRVAHSDVELWTLPMFHCNGWGGVYALTGMGGTHVILRAIDGAKIYELIANEGVTFACMAPAVLRAILDYPDKASTRSAPSPLHRRGAPPPAAFIERLEKELGWDFIQIYGLTETAPVITVSMPDYATKKEDWARRARAGVPALGVEIAVLDADDKPVPKDGVAVGEVCARSNVVFKGYWEQPEETNKAIHGGYFHTGDLAVWDEVGSIHIVDRAKDVIISGGENISSPDIEAALYKHPAVVECAVIGVPHGSGASAQSPGGLKPARS
jgi:fatty-acyl-CoA synthase